MCVCDVLVLILCQVITEDFVVLCSTGSEGAQHQHREADVDIRYKSCLLHHVKKFETKWRKSRTSLTHYVSECVRSEDLN